MKYVTLDIIFFIFYSQQLWLEIVKKRTLGSFGELG